MALDSSVDAYTSAVPTSLATQHPDSASRYVPIQEETEEAVEVLRDQPDGMGVEEFMVDFEGKTTPYHQTADIAHRLIEAGLVPGRDRWITPRVPNATEETVFRQLMALMSIIEADYDIFRSHHEGAIREVILPMVQRSSDMVSLRRRIQYLIELAHKEFGFEKNPNALQIIPLVESIPGMLTFTELFRDYYNQSHEMGFETYRLRPMIARSDSALAFGLVPSILASKIMLSDAYDLGDELGIPVAPIFGGGSLPFRGHVSAENLNGLLDAFPGIRTVTVQSGVRYDHPPESVRDLVGTLKERLGPHNKNIRAENIDPDTQRELKDIILIFAYGYMQSFAELSSVVSIVDQVIPQQRDRLMPRSPSGYARTVPAPKDLEYLAGDDKVRALMSSGRGTAISSVPRAISFTAALYSVGLPPEFIGLGEGLQRLVDLKGTEGVERLLKYAPGLKADLEFARMYLSLDVAKEFFAVEWFAALRKSIETAEEILGTEIYGHQDHSYATLLEIIEPMLRHRLHGHALGSEDATLLRTCIIRLGKKRGSLG